MSPFPRMSACPGVALAEPIVRTRFSTPVTAPLTQTSVGNLTASAQRYLDRLGLGVEDLFHHILATLHDPAYREANAGALQME